VVPFFMEKKIDSTRLPGPSGGVRCCFIGGDNYELAETLQSARALALAFAIASPRGSTNHRDHRHRAQERQTLYLSRLLYPGRRETFTDTALAATILLWILQQVLAHQRLLHVKLDATGQPEQPEALTRLAQDHVVVRLESRICHERPAINLGSLQHFPVETQEVAPLLFPAVCTLGHLLRLLCHAPERVLIS